MSRARARLRSRRWPRRIGVAALVLCLAVVLALAAPALHLIDSQPIRLFAADHPNPKVVAVYVSGDMGLKYGMGPKVAPALAARGIPVIGVSSSVNFATHRTRAEADAIIQNAIRFALKKTGASEVVLMGQSFGSDIVATTAPDLPPDLRSRIKAIVMVVPAQTVFFRSDPTGLTYFGRPDATPAAAMRAVDWAPVVCIYGEQETESLCPALARRARTISLPGGHFLHYDDKLLVATIVDALRRIDPAMLR